MGQMVVLGDEGKAGTGACGTYHAFAYVKEKLAKGFEVVEFIERGVGQDFYLLRKLISGNT